MAMKLSSVSKLTKMKITNRLVGHRCQLGDGLSSLASPGRPGSRVASRHDHRLSSMVAPLVRYGIQCESWARFAGPKWHLLSPDVLPGESIISHDNMPFPIDEDEQTVHVEAGQTVYFQCVIGLSLIFEEADDQERAARTVSRLQPLN